MHCCARYLPLLLVTAAAVGAAPEASPPNSTVSQILARYEAARPRDVDLQLFALDWAGSLREAKERAAKEGRPILFVATTQLKEAGDLRGGHC